MKMIEKVARAICIANNQNPNDKVYRGVPPVGAKNTYYPYGELIEAWKAFQYDALLAIQAMKDATECNFPNEFYKIKKKQGYDDIKSCFSFADWERSIDAILIEANR